MQVSDEFFFLDFPFYCRLLQLLDEVECVRGLRVGRPGGLTDEWRGWVVWGGDRSGRLVVQTVEMVGIFRLCFRRP